MVNLSISRWKMIPNTGFYRVNDDHDDETPLAKEYTIMDENLGYGNLDEEEKRHLSSSQWHPTHDSDTSLDENTSDLFLQYQNYHLHLLKKREVVSERPIIPSSKQERLSYYRNYVASPNKLQIACMSNMNFNKYFWDYISNTIVKSLSHTYVYIFLSSYVPEEHLFAAKMVPFMCGVKLAFIITGLLEVITYVSNTTWLLDYLIGGIFFKNPWNRCPSEGYYGGLLKCYNLYEFGERVQNTTVTFRQGFYYIKEDNEYLQLAQIEYYRHRIKNMSRVLFSVYTCLIWGLITACNKQIFKKNFWKFLNIVHWSVICMDVASFIYLMITFFEEDHIIQDIPFTQTPYAIAIENADLEFLAEFTAAPPVVHVLTARSTQEISPGRDSAIFVLSNGICYVFRAMLSYRVKQHCESLANVPIYLPGITNIAWLYFWPMYFSTFFLGDMYTLIFLSLNFVIEIMTTVVTFECLVEVLAREWPILQRWMVTLGLTVIGLGVNIFCKMDFSILLNYNKATATFLEVIIVYWLYPAWRLFDDITFHYGTPHSTCRNVMLYVVPIFYLMNYFDLMVVTLPVIIEYREFNSNYLALLLALTLVLAPVLMGMLYSYYRYVWKERRDWKRMFAPVEDWGPRDYYTRQLRKEFDSRTYYISQEPRNLSRHIISKIDSNTYRLDIKYDPHRRSTVVQSEFTSEYEKEGYI